MLVDVHAHFYHPQTPRADWRERNASRLAAGDKIGISVHVASILGSWGLTSPIYFPSPRDVTAGDDAPPPPQPPPPPPLPGSACADPDHIAHPPAGNARRPAAGGVGVQP